MKSTQHLIKTQQRPKAALFVECGDAREVHDFATLLGFGSDGVCPYMAYEALSKMNQDGVISARANETFTDEVGVTSHTFTSQSISFSFALL